MFRDCAHSKLYMHVLYYENIYILYGFIIIA